jgi:GNAT superfamily N-acetyltransferase
MSEQHTMDVRAARAEDRAAAQVVTVAAYEQYAEFMPAWAWEAYRDDMIKAIADSANGEHIVAEHDGELVGSVLLLSPQLTHEKRVGPQPVEVPEVRLLAVTPSARGRGIGAALMEECIRRARQAGYPSLTLHTHEVMAIAMRMYEKMGFVRAPELDFSPRPDMLIKGYRLAL